MSKSNVTRKITTQRVKKNQIFFSHLNTFGTPSRLRSSPSFPSRGSMPFNISLGSTGPPAMSETQWRVNILVNTSNSVLHVLLRKAVFCLFLNNKYSTDVYIGPLACQILSSRTPRGTWTLFNTKTTRIQTHLYYIIFRVLIQLPPSITINMTTALKSDKATRYTTISQGNTDFSSKILPNFPLLCSLC